MSRSAVSLVAILCAWNLPQAAPVEAQEPVAASRTAGAPAVDLDGDEIGVDEVSRGQTGYGLSVFAGSEPERFGVEVVGVLREMDPGTSFIVARLSGKGLEESGVVAGMSGSPVYIDDRLAGAVAYSWAFTSEALALITPIAAMRQLSSLDPGEAAGGSLGLSAPGTPAPFERSVRQILEPPEDVAEAVREVVAEQLGALLAPADWGGRGASIATLGFGEPVRRMLAAAPAGRAEPSDAPDLGAGSAVAGVLIDGDLKLAVGGTVTRVEDGEVLAMGHPYLGVGPLGVPMATVEVVGVVPRLNSSTRLSNIGPVVGAFDQDRFAGLRGTLGAEARTIPMTIDVETPNGESRRFDLRLADLPIMLPSLVGIPTMQALDSASYGAGESSLDMSGTLRLRGHDDVPLRQVFDGSNPGTRAAFYLIALVGALVHSDYEAVEVEGVDLTLRQGHAPRTITIERAQASSTRVHAGDTVQVVFDLRRHRGDRFQETLDVVVPEDRRPGRYYLFVGDGVSIDAARLQLQPGKASSLEDELKLLRSFKSQSRLAALGVVPARGLIVEGRPMPDLPATVRSIWQASPLQGEPRALNLAIVSEDGRDLGTPLDGLFRIDLQILPGTTP
ncbi:MAG: hypothetical protein OYL92_07070 [Acidobacteriota bacterium]|nr:hypothetical protein [Acidobacteriota bacterium]MDE3264716.1 hypothetical protein [Acidobacteriota bacterium]